MIITIEENNFAAESKIPDHLILYPYKDMKQKKKQKHEQSNINNL
jgi:hypothetical protein